MKKIMILQKLSIKHLVILLFTGTFSMPATGNTGDTIFYHEKNGTKIHVVKEGLFKRKDFFHVFFIDLGANRLDKSNMFTGAEHGSAADFPKLNNAKSISFSMHSMFGRRIAGSLSIMSGLGIDWVNYRFSQDVTIKEIGGVATQVPISSFIDDFSSMKKSKLTGSYINVPLLLRINFLKFFVAAGVTGGVNIGSHTKIVFVNSPGRKNKYKDHDIHLATFRYGYSMRAGFKNLSLFANYYTSPLFARNEGPRVYPFAIGISFNLD
jgi:hypothetical protein